MNSGFIVNDSENCFELDLITLDSLGSSRVGEGEGLFVLSCIIRVEELGRGDCFDLMDCEGNE